MDLSEVAPKPIERPFDPGREPNSEAVRSVVEEALRCLGNYEAYFSVRKRQRKAADRAQFETTVSAILCDLIHRETTVAGGWLGITRSKRLLGGQHRKRAGALSTQIPKILDLMTKPEMDMIHMTLGKPGPPGESRQSVIRAGSWLLNRVAYLELTVRDVYKGNVLTHDPLQLRAEKVKGKKGSRVPIPETDLVQSMRSEMDRINTFLAQADIRWTSPDLPQPDLQNRSLVRIFNNQRMDHGGRLNGGFWQGLASSTRLQAIEIQGRIAVSLDFGQMAVRLAYASVDVVPRNGDLYAIPYSRRFDREAIKPVLNALLSSTKLPSRFPQGTKHGFWHRGRFARFGEVLAAISRTHPALVPLFGTGLAFALQHKESNILVTSLLRLANEDIVALPVHDAILVAQGKHKRATAILKECFREATGQECVVEEEVYSPREYGWEWDVVSPVAGRKSRAIPKKPKAG